MRNNVLYLRIISAACAAALLVACGGGTLGSQAIPGASGSSDAAMRHRSDKKVPVTLRIKIPKRRVRGGRHPQYVSSATQSMKLLITNTSPVINVSEIANLTPTSTGCTSTLASTSCQLSVSLAPASNYSATVTTYDQTNASGNELSAAQAVSFNVVAGTNNAVALALSGVPAQIMVLPGSGSSNTNVTGGIDLIGVSQNKLLAVAMDADKNIILGAGSPTFTIAQTVGAFTVTLTQPGTGSPNVFYVQPPSAYTAGTTKLTVKASYAGQTTDGCAQSGAVCQADVSVDMQQVVAAMDSTSVQVFELGTTSAVATVTSGIGQANAIAFDTSGNLYVANCESGCSLSGTDAVLKYAPPYTGTPVAITTGISKPESLGFDTNGNLYVANYNANVNGNVTKFAPPFTSASVAVTTYTNGIGSPIALALDPANDLFVASLQGNSGNGTVSGYKASNSGGLADYGPITQGVQIPAAIALDASANLYVASPSGYKITKYYGYNAVVSGQTAYTCTSTCGNGISANPRTITGCNSCSASTFTPVALITLPTSSNAPLGYALFAADKTNNAVYEYSNGTNTSNTVSRSITSNVLGPAGLLLDASANLYVANQTAGTVTQYNATTYPFASTITSAFTNPTALAILP